MNAPGMEPSISLLARSSEPAESVEAVVTLPTFRRPEQLLRTLHSLQNQKTSRRFAVVVIENEAEHREGAAAAAPLFEQNLLSGMVIVAHQRGNCSAYNAGWETSLIQYPSFRHLLVIDDDEWADATWLETMIATAEQLGADIVGGPQRPVFAQPGSHPLQNHPVFAPAYAKTGLVPALYSSGNLLVSRDVLATMKAPFLDTRFNFLGGGDSDFLSRCAQRGFKLAWCEEAPVYETVADRRLEQDWIRARSLRNGVISTLVEQRRRAAEPLGASRTFAKSLALLAASPARGLRDGIATKSLHAGLYPVHVGLGRVLAHFGYQNEQYRQPEKN